jgi:hypothetical protein
VRVHSLEQEMNMGDSTDHTAAATPAGGGPFVGMRRRVYRAVMGHEWCDECGNKFTEDQCPYCRQRRRRGGAGLEVGVDVFPLGWFSTFEWADDEDGQGWVDDPDEGDDGEGWPW